jgi:uncharacterized membrane protein
VPAPHRHPVAAGDRQEQGHEAEPNAREHPSLTRIAAFSDGVFAFAITLLILGIRIPHPSDSDAGQGLLTLLIQQWRNYLAFVLSFMLIGINWANHRVMWKTFARADNTLVWLNLLFLMIGAAFMPLPAAVLGSWLGDPKNELVATLFYGGSATVGGLLFNVVWWYGAYIGRLTSPALDDRTRHAHTIAWAPAPIMVALLTVVAFISPDVAVAGFVLLVLVYVLPTPRLVSAIRSHFDPPSRRRTARS